MPIRDCPFTNCGGVYRPILPVKIVNPHTGKSYSTRGIIDTGADECAIPAALASLLGHKQAGKTKTIGTGNGVTAAYAHTTKFEIYHPVLGDLIYTIPDTPVDFLPNLHIVLLGANNFLSRLVLTIDYPNKRFSIKYP